MGLLWPSLHWASTVQRHYCTAGWMGEMSHARRVERLQWEDRREGMYVCVCVGLSWESRRLLNWPSIRQGPSIQTPTSTPTSSTTPSQGPSARLSASPGSSTLISHLWRPNELRLLVHLWDLTDYQTGGRPFVNGKRWHLHCWPCCQGDKNQNGGGEGGEKKRKEEESNQKLWSAIQSQALP